MREGEYPAGEAPLETAWTFWYDKKTTDKKESDQYIEGLRQVGSFNTIEGFYRHYQYLLRPSELPRDHNVYLFRKHYKPMWEEFPEGGCWIIRIKRKSPQSYANHMWENLLLACIGEAFEMPDVVGAVLSTRLKDDVLSIWNLSNRGTPARFRIGEKLKEILDLNMTALIQYKDHMQSLQDYSTYRNAKNYMFSPSPAMTPLQRALDTPVYTHQGHPDSECGDGAMLPPAAMDDMLPPAAVDSEGFSGLDGGWGGGQGPPRPRTGSSRSGSQCNSATVSPYLSALKSPALGVTPSPSLSAAAAPWYPSGSKPDATEKTSKDEPIAKPSGATGPSGPSGAPAQRSWAAIAAGNAK